MNASDEFDRRWQELAARARRAAEPAVVADEVQAARLAQLGLAVIRQQREAARTWRGLATAAALFLACLLGLGAAASLVSAPGVPVWTLPSTAFIPAPPHPPALASLTGGGWSPARVFSAVDAWFDPRTRTAETLP